MTIVGTTDVDDSSELVDDPAISADEVEYLMQFIDFVFPSLRITRDDVISSWAGVRPTINTGKADPSKETRDHAVWDENGLITVTGGKLTTFRVVANAALKALRTYFPDRRSPSRKPLLASPENSISSTGSLDIAVKRRLLGRYGPAANALLEAAQPGELETIEGTPYLWAELRWAARSEAVIHLDDLLLRRIRLGLMLPRGGTGIINQIRRICQPELGWSDALWDQEQNTYFALWKKSYSLPLANCN